MLHYSGISVCRLHSRGVYNRSAIVDVNFIKMQATSQTVKCSLSPPLPHLFLLLVSHSIRLDVPLHRLAFSLTSVSVSLSVLTYSPSHISPSLLSFSQVCFSLIPRALSQFCSRWRRILWEAACTHKTLRVEEIEGRIKHVPSCVWVSLEGLCHLHSRLNIFALVCLVILVCCVVFVCMRVGTCLDAPVDICVRVCEYVRIKKVLSDSQVRAWLDFLCWLAGAGLLIFSSAPLDLVLILNQTLKHRERLREVVQWGRRNTSHLGKKRLTAYGNIGKCKHAVDLLSVIWSNVVFSLHFGFIFRSWKHN